MPRKPELLNGSVSERYAGTSGNQEKLMSDVDKVMNRIVEERLVELLMEHGAREESSATSRLYRPVCLCPPPFTFRPLPLASLPWS